MKKPAFVMAVAAPLLLRVIQVNPVFTQLFVAIIYRYSTGNAVTAPPLRSELTMVKVPGSGRMIKVI
jgi:hypothetical protein